MTAPALPPGKQKRNSCASLYQRLTAVLSCGARTSTCMNVAGQRTSLARQIKAAARQSFVSSQLQRKNNSVSTRLLHTFFDAAQFHFLPKLPHGGGYGDRKNCREKKKGG